MGDRRRERTLSMRVPELLLNSSRIFASNDAKGAALGGNIALSGAAPPMRVGARGKGDVASPLGRVTRAAALPPLACPLRARALTIAICVRGGAPEMCARTCSRTSIEHVRDRHRSQVFVLVATAR
jgi:hypothetical protein